MADERVARGIVACGDYKRPCAGTKGVLCLNPTRMSEKSNTRDSERADEERGAVARACGLNKGLVCCQGVLSLGSENKVGPIST